MGARADLNSLGILIWEILTGKVPFEAEDEMGVIAGPGQQSIARVALGTVKRIKPILASELNRKHLVQWQFADSLTACGENRVADSGCKWR